MPEDLPVTKGINVMVVITRSKVIDINVFKGYYINYLVGMLTLASTISIQISFRTV